MKRIKKFYREHRVFTILMAIILVCVIIISTILIQCFYIGKGTDKYGDRLDGIEEHEISDAKISDYENNLANNDKVKTADLIIEGRIIYIKVTYEDNCSLEEAESIAAKSLENFSEDEQGFYDFNITLEKNATKTSDGFLISGAHNRNGNGISWNNNREVTSTTDEE